MIPIYERGGDRGVWAHYRRISIPGKAYDRTLSVDSQREGKSVAEEEEG